MKPFIIAEMTLMMMIIIIITDLYSAFRFKDTEALEGRSMSLAMVQFSDVATR